MTNKSYKIKRLNGVKLTEVLLYSKEYMFSGKIDEAIEASNEVLIIERKYSDYVIVGSTMKTQLGLLAILAEENFGKKVKRAIIVFDKTKRVEIPVKITKNIKQLALSVLQKTRAVLSSGLIPLSTFDNRCLNCCYRKILSTLHFKKATVNRWFCNLCVSYFLGKPFLYKGANNHEIMKNQFSKRRKICLKNTINPNLLAVQKGNPSKQVM